VRLEGLGQLKKKIYLVGTRTRDLPVCSAVPQPTTLPRTILDRYITKTKFARQIRCIRLHFRAVFHRKHSMLSKIKNMETSHFRSYMHSKFQHVTISTPPDVAQISERNYGRNIQVSISASNMFNKSFTRRVYYITSVNSVRYVRHVCFCGR
jgi:hypothetical protein